jgi:hypothetical protein
MKKNVTGLHGKRFAVHTMEIRLKPQTACFSPAVAAHNDGVLVGNADDKAVIDRDAGSQNKSNDVADDSDMQDF